MTPRDDLVQWALAQVGKPYDTYRDCSGFVAAAYRQIGITIPEGSVAQWTAGHKTLTLDWELGDLHFWDTFGPAPGHVALYVGDGKVVHALNKEKGIVISRLSDDMGGPYMGARRIFLPDVSPVEDKPSPKEENPRPKPKRRRNRRKDRA